VGKTRILVANEPRTYREAITDVLRELRPHVEVTAVEPDHLDREIGRFRPQLVVCSRPCVAQRNTPLTWVVLYPNGENHAEVIIAGERATVVGITFGDFISIVDSTEVLCLSA
jgi:hypothetical protein